MLFSDTILFVNKLLISIFKNTLKGVLNNVLIISPFAKYVLSFTVVPISCLIYKHFTSRERDFNMRLQFQFSWFKFGIGFFSGAGSYKDVALKTRVKPTVRLVLLKI